MIRMMRHGCISLVALYASVLSLASGSSKRVRATFSSCKEPLVKGSDSVNAMWADIIEVGICIEPSSPNRNYWS